MTKVVISVFIGIALYFVALGVWVLIKKFRANKKFKKELKEHEEAKDEDTTNTTKE